MDATCLHVLHSLVVSKLGKEGVKIVTSNVKKAESEIAAFLWEQRVTRPSLVLSLWGEKLGKARISILIACKEGLWKCVQAGRETLWI
jgi:hypothetical protein